MLPWGVFFIWRRKAHHKSGSLFCWQPKENTEKGNFAFCLLSLILAGKFIYSFATPVINPASPWFWHRLRISRSLKILQNPSSRLQMQRHPAFCTEQLFGVQPFHCETDIAGLPRPDPVSKSRSTPSPIATFILSVLFNRNPDYVHRYSIPCW